MVIIAIRLAHIILWLLKTQQNYVHTKIQIYKNIVEIITIRSAQNNVGTGGIQNYVNQNFFTDFQFYKNHYNHINAT